MQSSEQSSQHVAPSDNLKKKPFSSHRKDIKFSLFIVNSSVTATCLFSSSYKVLLNYSILKPRSVNRNVDKTKLQDALTSTDFRILVLKTLNGIRLLPFSSK